MSGRMTVEHGIKYIKDGGYSRTAKVNDYEGTTWYGKPQLARVPSHLSTSRANARFDDTDGVLFGLNYKQDTYDSDGEPTGSLYTETVNLHMTKEEAIALAKYLLIAATGDGSL